MNNQYETETLGDDFNGMQLVDLPNGDTQPAVSMDDVRKAFFRDNFQIDRFVDEYDVELEMDHDRPETFLKAKPDIFHSDRILMGGETNVPLIVIGIGSMFAFLGAVAFLAVSSVGGMSALIENRPSINSGGLSLNKPSRNVVVDLSQVNEQDPQPSKKAIVSPRLGSNKAQLSEILPKLWYARKQIALQTPELASVDDALLGMLAERSLDVSVVVYTPKTVESVKLAEKLQNSATGTINFVFGPLDGNMRIAVDDRVFLLNH